MSNTVGLSADGDTFGAVFSFTGLIGAFDLGEIYNMNIEN